MSREPQNANVDTVNADTTSNFELVLDLVMSYLPTKDCVRTSILSSRWRCRWTTIPSLVFDMACCSCSRMYSHKEQSKALTSIINHVLLLHNGSIEVFQARGLCVVPDIDRWILRVSKNSIKTFVLEIFYGTTLYQLPSSLFTCGSMTSLKLTNCLLMPPPLSFKGLKNLKHLELEFVTLANDAFEMLISSCPSLKELTLIVLKQQDTVQYQIPSLLYTCCWSLSSLKLRNCLLMSPPSSFKGFKNLKSLELESVTLTNDALEKLISSCPLLKKLLLFELEEADNLKINAPNLQHIDIFGDFVGITFGCAMTMLSVVYIFASECTYASLLDLFIKHPNIQRLGLSCHMGFMSGDSIVESLPFQCKDLYRLAISMDFSFDGEVPSLYLYRGSCDLKEECVEVWGRCYLAIELGVWEENSNCHHEFKQLRRAQMKSFRGAKAELEFLKFVLGNSPVLEEMKVNPGLKPVRLQWEDVKSIYEFTRASKAKIFFDELVTQIC